MPHATIYWRIPAHTLLATKAPLIMRAKGRQTQKQIVELLRQYVERLKSAPCTDCKKKFPPISMDFDHRDPSTKSFSISELIVTAPSFEILRAEIDKCDLVCANCHRVRTRQQMMTPGFIRRVRRQPPQLTIPKILKQEIEVKALDPMQLFYSVQQVTKMLNVSRETLRRWERDLLFPKRIKLGTGGKSARAAFHRDDIQAWIETRKELV